MEYILCNGFSVNNLTKENKGILDLLCKCKKEADDFIYGFLMGAVNENIAVGDYRLHRILERNMLLDEFNGGFENDSVQACEELFKHPVNKQMFSLLTNKINDGTITPMVLFNRHKSQPRAKMLRLLL